MQTLRHPHFVVMTTASPILSWPGLTRLSINILKLRPFPLDSRLKGGYDTAPLGGTTWVTHDRD